MPYKSNIASSVNGTIFNFVHYFLSPAVGISFCIYTNPNHLRPPRVLYVEMAYDNSIGAWWLGFLVIAGLKLCVIIVLLVGFPERQSAFQGGAVSANVKDELRGYVK